MGSMGRGSAFNSIRKTGGTAGSMLAAALLILVGARVAAAKISMVIEGPGSRQAAIAVSPLKNLAGDDAHDVSRDFDTVLSRDLEISGYFRIISPQSYIEDAQTSGYQQGQFNFPDWSSINAEFLVKGAATVNGNQVTLEALLFDVAQQRQIIGKRFTGGRAEVERMARRFADSLLEAITGTEGPFDSMLACVSTRGGRFKEIYTMSLEGRDVRRITNNPTINLFPSLDKTARYLLYTSYKTASPALYLADLTARREHPITTREGMLIGGALAPDGKSLVGAVENRGATNLYLFDSGGELLQPITRGTSINVSPAFSADGQLLAFTSDRSGTPQIWVTSVGAGGDPRRLTFQGNYNTNPAISPKGDRVAYQARSGGQFDLYVISIAGGEPHRLTQGAGSNESPSWSPDGRYLAFSSNRSGHNRLYIIHVDSLRTVPITEDEGDDSNPAWSWWLGE